MDRSIVQLQRLSRSQSSILNSHCSLFSIWFFVGKTFYVRVGCSSVAISIAKNGVSWISHLRSGVSRAGYRIKYKCPNNFFQKLGREILRANDNFRRIFLIKFGLPSTKCHVVGKRTFVEHAQNDLHDGSTNQITDYRMRRIWPRGAFDFREIEGRFSRTKGPRGEQSTRRKNVLEKKEVNERFKLILI